MNAQSASRKERCWALDIAKGSLPANWRLFNYIRLWYFEGFIYSSLPQLVHNPDRYLLWLWYLYGVIIWVLTEYIDPEHGIKTPLIHAKGHILYKQVGAMGLESQTSIIILYVPLMKINQTERVAGSCKFLGEAPYGVTMPPSRKHNMHWIICQNRLHVPVVTVNGSLSWGIEAGSHIWSSYPLSPQNFCFSSLQL